jgi:hypothetical protein
MKTVLRLAFFPIMALILLAGCGGSKTGNLSAKEEVAFDNASPELKQAWEKALESGKTNDYAPALTQLDSLSRQSLSPEQRQALQKEIATLSQRLYDAVGKGDPSAQKALQEWRRNTSNRSR